MKKCELCQQIIEGHGKRFCSQTCHRKWKKRKPKSMYEDGGGYIKPMGKCLFCGKGFVKNVPHRKFCSKTCAMDQYKKDHPSMLQHYWKTRFEVFSRDGFRCVYCGRSPKDGTTLQIEHVHPKSMGGENDIKNYVTSCIECNLGKGDALLEKHALKYAKIS